MQGRSCQTIERSINCAYTVYIYVSVSKALKSFALKDQVLLVPQIVLAPGADEVQRERIRQ